MNRKVGLKVGVVSALAFAAIATISTVIRKRRAMKKYRDEVEAV